MKKKTFVGVILTVLLVLQIQTVFADGQVRVRCLANPNRNNDILGRVSINGSYFPTLVGHDYSSGSHLFENVKNGPYLVTVKSFKWSRSEFREAYSETLRIEVYNNYTFITCSFDNNGRILNLKIDQQEDIVDEFVSEYIEKRDATGLSAYLQRNNLNLDEYVNRRLSAGNTRLINEIKKSSVNFGNVQFLVENGARVNLRNELGETAASIAYDKGEIEIYNYLKENGAIDFEPRQIAQQPAVPAPSSTTNVYVQPSAPVQSAPQSPAIPTLQAGTYAASGTNHTMTLMRISDTSGTVNYYVGGGLAVGSGTYRISNNQLSLSFGPLSSNEGLKNKTFIYNITSSTSFSGSGEIWARR